MLSRIRNSVFFNLLWGIMALYLLNISVDTADPKPDYIPEDLSINDQESIVELVVEKVLGFEDAIKEYDDHDTEDYNKTKNVKIDLLEQVIKFNNFDRNQFVERKNCYTDFAARLAKGFYEIDSPPPKA